MILNELSGKDDVTQAVLLAQAFAVNSKREFNDLTKMIHKLQETQKKIKRCTNLMAPFWL